MGRKRKCITDGDTNKPNSRASTSCQDRPQKQNKRTQPDSPKIKEGGTDNRTSDVSMLKKQSRPLTSYESLADDFMFSQNDGVGEVGWGCIHSEQEPENQPSSVDIGKLVRAFSVGQEGGAGNGPPFTPPMLKSWLESPGAGGSDASPTGQPSRRQLGKRARQAAIRGKRGRHSHMRTTERAEQCRELLEKLAMLYEKQEQSPEGSESNDGRPSKRSRLQLDSESADSLEEDFNVDNLASPPDLFGPTQPPGSGTSTQANSVPATSVFPDFPCLSPIVNMAPCRPLQSPGMEASCKSPVLQQNLLSTPVQSHKRVVSLRDTPKSTRQAANKSTDDLWTDEELFENDSFLALTQNISANCGKTPPFAGRKGKRLSLEKSPKTNNAQPVDSARSVNTNEPLFKQPHPVVSTRLDVINTNNDYTTSAEPNDKSMKLPSNAKVNAIPPAVFKPSIETSRSTSRKPLDKTSTRQGSPKTREIVLRKSRALNSPLKARKFNFQRTNRDTPEISPNSDTGKLNKGPDSVSEQNSGKTIGIKNSTFVTNNVDKKNGLSLKPVDTSNKCQKENRQVGVHQTSENPANLLNELSHPDTVLDFLFESTTVRKQKGQSASKTSNQLAEQEKSKTVEATTDTQAMRLLDDSLNGGDSLLDGGDLLATQQLLALLDSVESTALSEGVATSPSDTGRSMTDKKMSAKSTLSTGPVTTSISKGSVKSSSTSSYTGFSDSVSTLNDRRISPTLSGASHIARTNPSVRVNNRNPEFGNTPSHKRDVIDNKGIDRNCANISPPVSNVTAKGDRYTNSNTVAPKRSSTAPVSVNCVAETVRNVQPVVEIPLESRLVSRSFQKFPSFDTLNTHASPRTELSESISSSQDSPKGKKYTQQQIEQKRLEAIQKRKNRLRLNKS